MRGKRVQTRRLPQCSAHYCARCCCRWSTLRAHAHRTVVGPRSTTAVLGHLRAKRTHVQHRPCYVAKASDAFDDSLQAGPISLSLCLSLYRSCKFLLIFFGILILISPHSFPLSCYLPFVPFPPSKIPFHAMIKARMQVDSTFAIIRVQHHM